MKKKLSIIIPIALFVVFLVLSIVLLCSPVFHGKYACKKTNGDTIVFDFVNDEIVSQKITSHGIPQSRFFGYVISNGEVFIGKGSDSLVTPQSYAVKFVRKSVFQLEYLEVDQNGNVAQILSFKCGSAIGLFVFFSVIALGSLMLSLSFIVKSTKKTRKKIEDLETQKKSLEEVLNNLKK